MISNKHVIFILAALFLGVACSNQSPNAEDTESGDSGKQKTEKVNTSIEGAFIGAEGALILIQYLGANSVTNIDTVRADKDGEFELEFYLDKPGYYRVGLGEKNMCVLILEPGENVELTANADNIFGTYKVKGSPESQRLQDLNGILSKRDSIGMVLQEAQMSQDRTKFQSAMGEYQQIMANVNQNVKSFIDDKPGTLSSLAAVQNLDPAEDNDYFVKVVEALEGKANGNEFFEAIKSQVQSSKQLAIGADAPAISLPQPDGAILNLSDLQGQYVLIDFWASWCAPCRKENPNVKRVYDKYNDKGFEILGVSLDKNKNAWLAAIEQDQLNWKHVSDLKYWQSSVVPVYQIKGIPLTYLIDPEGKIVAKNLRGASLEQKLAEIFGE